MKKNITDVLTRSITRVMILPIASQMHQPGIAMTASAPQTEVICTTLNRIREHSPCQEGWAKLLKHLGKTKADDAPLPYSVILESNGLDDALWCCRAEPQHASLWRHCAVDFAETVKHLMSDQRCLTALEVARAFADGRATESELAAARDAAWDAARAAAWDAAWDAAWAAARDAAWDAAWDAARDAAWDAARDAAWDAARDAAIKTMSTMFLARVGVAVREVA